MTLSSCMRRGLGRTALGLRSLPANEQDEYEQRAEQRDGKRIPLHRAIDDHELEQLARECRLAQALHGGRVAQLVEKLHGVQLAQRELTRGGGGRQGAGGQAAGPREARRAGGEVAVRRSQWHALGNPCYALTVASCNADRTGQGRQETRRAVDCAAAPTRRATARTLTGTKASAADSMAMS